MAECLSPTRINAVIVGNNREYFSPIDPYVSDSLKDEFIQSDIDEADMDIMWHGDNKIVLLPKVIDPAFIADVSRLFKYQNVHVYIPHDKGIGLSRNIAQDRQLYGVVANSLRISPDPKVIPWGYTPQYQELVDTLKTEGVIFSTPETPLHNALWTPEYLDTKIGSREILLRAKAKNSDIKIPEGFICADINSAMRIAEYFLETNRGVVFKANIGAAGIGVNVFPPSEFDRNIEDNRAKIDAKIRANSLLTTGPVVVEEYIPPDFSHHGVFPSVDSIVRPNGTVDVQAVDAMVIHHDDEAVGFLRMCIGQRFIYKRAEYKVKKNE